MVNNSNWKKLLGFRNMQEKLEKKIFQFNKMRSMKKLIEMQCGDFIQIMISYIICPDVVLSPDKFEGGPFF